MLCGVLLLLLLLLLPGDDDEKGEFALFEENVGEVVILFLATEMTSFIDGSLKHVLKKWESKDMSVSVTNSMNVDEEKVDSEL